MPDEVQRYRIEVVVDPRSAVDGTKTIERRFSSLENSADRLRRLLRTTFFFFGLTASIKQLFDLSDAYTKIENRVRLVTKSDEERQVVLQKLFEVSNRVRIGTEQVAELYVRTALSARLLGRSQQELINFTESVSEALILSGASAQEANSGLIQLSQGIAANRLGGDELRSVLEQLPAVADVIAKQLGVTRGELRRLGTEGRITAAVILDAFKNAREELAERFAQTIPTIGQAFEVLRNSLLRLIGEFNRAAGAGEIVAKIILSLAVNIETVVRVLAGLASALGVTLLIVGFQRATVAFLAFSKALLFNPLTLFPAAVALAIGAVVSFGDKLKLSIGSFATLQDVVVSAFAVITETISSFGVFFGDTVEEADKNTSLSLRKILEGFALTFDAIVGLIRGSFNVVKLAFSTLPTSLGVALDTALVFVREFAENITQVFVALSKTFGLTITQSARDVRNVVTGYIGAISAGIKGNADAAESFLESADSAASRLSQTFTSFPEKLQGELARLKTVQFFDPVDVRQDATVTAENFASAFRKGVTSATGAEDSIGEAIKRAESVGVARAAKEQADAAKLAAVDLTTAGTAVRNLTQDEIDLLGAITGATPELIRQSAALEGLKEQDAISPEQYQRFFDKLQIKALEASTSLEDGFHRAFLKLSLEAEDFAAAAEKALNTVADFGTDALVDLARTGGENFKQLADSAVQEIQRIIARLIILQAIKFIGNQLAPGAGDVAAGAIDAAPRALGGFTQPNRSYLVGERGPELFRPQQAGSIVSNAALTAPQKPPQVNVQVVNVSDPNEVPAAIDAGGSDRAIINVLQRNRNAVAQITSR